MPTIEHSNALYENICKCHCSPIPILHLNAQEDRGAARTRASGAVLSSFVDKLSNTI
jgi:hypothetical protein